MIELSHRKKKLVHWAKSNSAISTQTGSACYTITQNNIHKVKISWIIPNGKTCECLFPCLIWTTLQFWTDLADQLKLDPIKFNFFV